MKRAASIAAATNARKKAKIVSMTEPAARAKVSIADVLASLDPEKDAEILPFVRHAAKLTGVREVPKRLVEHGLARIVGGELLLREDAKEFFDGPYQFAKDLLEAGYSRNAVLDALADRAAKEGATASESYFVLYMITCGTRFSGMWFDDLAYLGETQNTCAKRFEGGHKGSTKLRAAYAAAPGGRDAFTCRPILVLPEHLHFKELLLFFEAKFHELFDTVANGLNCHCGAGKWGGAVDEGRWLANYVAFMRHVPRTGELPRAKAEDEEEKRLGEWVSHQRSGRKTMTVPRKMALEMAACWEWQVKAANKTVAAKLDVLAGTDEYKGSGGWLFPPRSSAIGRMVAYLRLAIKGSTKYGVVTPEDLERIERDFPGLMVDGPEASIRHRVTTSIVPKYLDAKTGAFTKPSQTDDKASYGWYNQLVNGHTRPTEAMWAWLESVGLGCIRAARKDAETLAANAERKAERARIFNAARDELARAAKIAARQARKVSIATGPRHPEPEPQPLE